jgi:hypothetical protein
MKGVFLFSVLLGLAAFAIISFSASAQEGEPWIHDPSAPVDFQEQIKE